MCYYALCFSKLLKYKENNEEIDYINYNVDWTVRNKTVR